ncbi:glycerophosphodiester phosphodiesterase GDPDL3-like isoform X2 [Diospyros lotus]|uniref:glycerophosphodiester phosphodiesterase GDPDL3-like isoform X2 n=1 Tax=Diospyros lotus TaxID=55363 RepID=UPI0022580667|nr:glycerophosphodiester phosphodiesterase GDPDL3-like isoform X2 [Diospyros lotus]
MWKLWSLLHLLHLSSAMLASAKTRSNGTTLWKTLSGNAPLVIARGGFSGIFPDSSGGAYEFAGQTSLPDVINWCDVQLTKDGAGICFPDLTLDNASDIKQIYKNKGNTYYVNGVKTSGWFSVDFTINDLANVTLIQGIPARVPYYNGIYKILTVQVVAKLYPPELWLNVQHDAFFSQQNLSMRSYILSVFRSTKVDYISSPEVSFLKSILARKPNKTKLIFRFPGQAELVEPSTNQTYSSLLRNLTFIKTFASGILVPKTYIWPVDRDLYLEPHTSIVFDAHREGLEIFASDFANDNDFAYDFAYDPIAEYLHFIDNGNFSVDGVLSDFPITPSEAIGCFSHIGKRMKAQANPLVISSEGSSGYYPGCTDLAYQRAISGGVDVLDCPVQMSKDGIPVCLGSINLLDKTNVAESNFKNLILQIPELEGVTGIFTFSLTWSEIQSLKPKMSNPYGEDYKLYRNPKFSEDVKFMTLSEFLVLANNANSVSGVLISIEDAAYLAEKQGLSVIDAVLDALKNASHNNDTVKKVMIQSTDSAVLIKLREKSNYELVYKVQEAIRDADNLAITEIKKFANSVVVRKGSVFSFRGDYITSIKDVVSKLQAFNLSVYVGLFRNEFVSLAQDFLGDANVEINTFVKLVQIDGIITEFPGTASRHKRNRCLGLGDKMPTYMKPVRPGELLSFVPSFFSPPAEAPSPVLTEDDVVERPLPPVTEGAPAPSNGPAAAAAPTPPNGEAMVPPPFFLSHLAALLATLVFL